MLGLYANLADFQPRALDIRVQISAAPLLFAESICRVRKHSIAEAHSLPVLARRGTAMDELVHDGYNGYLFSSADEIPSLAEKILKNYKAFSHNAWKHSQNYTLEKYKERYLSILQGKDLRQRFGCQPSCFKNME